MQGPNDFFKNYIHNMQNLFSKITDNSNIPLEVLSYV